MSGGYDNGAGGASAGAVSGASVGDGGATRVEPFHEPAGPGYASPDYDEDDELDQEEAAQPSAWKRLLTTISNATSTRNGQNILSSGLIGTVGAPTFEGAAGSATTGYDGRSAADSTHYHGKPRDISPESSAEQRALMNSYLDATGGLKPSPSPSPPLPGEVREKSTSGLRIGGPVFHEQEDSDNEQHHEHKEAEHEAVVQKKEHVHAPPDHEHKRSAAEEAAARLQRRLASIADPDVRAALDPNSGVTLTEEELLAWPDAKLIEYVKAFDLSDMEALLLKLKSGEVQVSTRRPDAAELTTALSWRNLSYSVDGTVMLQNLSGYVRPGQLVAVLGGPDAGITTLLDVLAQRTHGRGEQLGDVFVNRRPISSDPSFARQVGYVRKADIHLPQLTVSETLYFSARLRNPGLSRRGAILRVALTMKLLGLLHCWKTVVGDEITRGVSGGEKRRVSFGLELVAGHNLILADLPTNGLDSGSALSLLQVYKTTTLLGKSLLCSLVQPSPQIYALLDFVLVLSKGACLYFGPADLAERHFSLLGFERPHTKSVPQFLEELSAAPEKFVAMERMHWGRHIGAAGTPKSAGMKSQRPLAVLREREERARRARQRVLAKTSASFAMPGKGQHDEHEHGHGHPWPTPKQVLSLRSHASIAGSDGSRALDHRPTSLGKGTGSDPLVPEGVLLQALSGSDPTTSHGIASRVRVWKDLVMGYEDSVFADDVSWVLAHDLTPAPVFRETKASKAARAKAKKAKEEAKKHAQQHGAGHKASTSNGGVGDIEMGVLTPDSSALTAENVAAAANTERAVAMANKMHKPPPPKPFPRQTAQATSFKTQYIENLGRFTVLFYRSKSLWLLNFIKSLIIGLLIGTLFYDLSLAQGNVRTRFGLFYFAMAFNSSNAQQLVPVLLSYRKVFQLQKEGQYYRPLTYYLAFCTVNIPIAAVETFLFFIVVYPLSGLRGGLGSDQSGYAYLMLLLVNLVSRSWVLMLSALTPTEALMNIVNGVFVIIFSIFSGFLNPRDSIPNGWIWAYYISYFTWALRGLNINEQKGLEYDCPPAPAPCTTRNGNDALALYGMDVDESEKWLCVLWMALFLVGFNFVAAWAMKTINVGAVDREEEPNFEPAHAKAEVAAVSNKPDIGAKPTAGKLAEQAKEAAPVPVEEEAPLGVHAAHISPVAAATHAPVLHAGFEKKSLLSPTSTSGAGGPGYISWRNLRYTIITDDKQERRLLNDVLGFAAPGMLVALMGASGAGKTTLLDVLAGKKTGGEITGELLVNGLPRDQAFSRVSGYVEQTDSHNERSTVREAVRFSAMLRLPKNITDDKDEVERRVDKVLDDLGISRLQNELIGNTNTGGISQEARKKVTIAVELIGEPRILFLDEPTTGLDSAGALSVMDCVVALSQRMAVLCTVHQPSAELFDKFNYICLLQPGGRTVYFGPVATLASHFSTEAGLPAYNPKDNLADYAITCAKTTVKPDSGALTPAAASPATPAAPGADARKRDELDLQGAFVNSPAGRVTLSHLERGVCPPEAKAAWEHEREVLAPGGNFKVLAPFGLQFRLLLGRFVRTLLRSPDLWFGRLFANILMAFIISTCFFQLGSDQTAAQSRVSCLFLAVNFLMGSGALKLPAIFTERAVVFRERHSSMYTALPYYLARWCHDLALWAFEDLVFAIMVYFICDLNSTDNYARFGLFYLLVLLTAQLGFVQSEFFALISPSSSSAYVIQGAASTVFSLFSGFLISKANMPIGWSWAYYVSPNRYPLTAGIQNELRGVTFTCPGGPTFPGAAPLCGLNDATALRCPVVCGEELLDGLGVETGASDEALMFGIIAVYIVGFKILGFFAFKYLEHIRR